MGKFSDSRDVFFCDCGCTEHMFVVDHFFWDGDFPTEFSIQPHLTNRPFLERLTYVWRYLLGKQSQHGAFDSIILDRYDVTRLRDNCNAFLGGRNNA